MKRIVDCPLCLKQTLTIVQYEAYALGLCSNQSCRAELQGGDIEAVLFAANISDDPDEDDDEDADEAIEPTEGDDPDGD